MHFKALMEFANEMSHYSHSGGFADDNLSTISIANSALERVPAEDRLELVEEVLSRLGPLGSIVRYIDLLEDDRDSPLDSVALDSLKVRLVDKMKREAEDGVLFSDRPSSGVVKFFRWGDWDQSADLANAIRVALSSPTTAAALLQSFIGVSYSSDGSGLTRVTRYPQLDGLDEAVRVLIDQWVLEHLPALEFDPEDKVVWTTYRTELLSSRDAGTPEGPARPAAGSSTESTPP